MELTDSNRHTDDESLTNDNQKSHDNSFSSATPFFADVTLDISMAHDIAETPEAVTRKTYDPNQHVSSLPNTLAMPPLPEFEQDQIASHVPSLSERLEEPLPTASKEDFKEDFDPTDQNQDQYFDESDHDGHEMTRVTSNNTPGGRFRPFGNTNGNWRSRLERKQFPKDISWAVAFWIVVPIGFIAPLILYGGSSRNGSDSSSASWLAAATSPRSATLHTVIWGLVVAAAILPRLLYRTSGGIGPGDDARHFASQILLVSAPFSAAVYLSLLVATYYLIPHAFWPYGLIPLWYLARDLYLFRRWKMTATTPGGRQAFFQALVCAALDILSRSLKRKVVYRTVVVVTIVQFGVIAVWRLSLLAALRSGSLFWTIVAVVGGKWASGTVARLLTLMACGGVSNWFAEQSSLLESMEEMQEQSGRDNNVADNVENEQNGKGNKVIEDSMPEAYRMADASEYKSTFNTGMDGDYESDDDVFEDEDGDEDENFGVFLNDSAQRTSNQVAARRRREQNQRRELHDARSSTVRQLLKAGLTVSFGSVAKCGLVGGFAQFLWSQIRKIDHARTTFGGMQVMPIHSEAGMNPEDHSEGIFQQIMKRISRYTRMFVRTHSDMAMSYVADYQMSYTRAAREVAMLLDEAGVEPIIHDDITTHMCACLGGSITGVIILFTGTILVHQRNRNDPDIPDSAVALDMVIAFFFCYTLIFTSLEPLRASIKAVYVCFAQRPEALSQAFPLIFHRLNRLSSHSNLRQ